MDNNYKPNYSMYGIFDGKPMIPSYNREERRKYIKQHKHDKEATQCDYCNAKTLTVTDDNSKFVCDLCGRFKLIKVEIKTSNYTTGLSQVLD